MLQFGTKNDVISKKKVFTKILTVFLVEIRLDDHQKKKSHFDGPPKIHGPRDHCIPCPRPLGGPDHNLSAMSSFIWTLLVL